MRITPRRVNALRVGLLSSLIMLLVAACGGGTASPTPEPTPDAIAMLQKAASEIQSSTSLRFKLQLTGAAAYVDYQNTIAFVSADGQYSEPDKVSAKVVAKLAGIPGEVEIIAIGDAQWMKNAILTGNRWLNQLFSPGFNAQKLIKSDEGIESAIQAFQDVKYLGKENIFGAEMHHLTGRATAAEISALTVELIRGSDVVADIYIDTATGRVDRVVMVQPETKTDTEEPSTWTLEVFDYNTDGIQITPPPSVGDNTNIAPGIPTIVPGTTFAPTTESTAEPTVGN